MLSQPPLFLEKCRNCTSQRNKINGFGGSDSCEKPVKAGAKAINLSAFFAKFPVFSTAEIALQPNC
jgi:hypothetical protein